MNVLVIGNNNEPLFNRIINIKAKLVYLQLENAVDLVHVNEKSLARRSEMEVSQRLPGTLVIDSKFALVQERAPQCATIKAAEERAVPTGRAGISLIELEQELSYTG